MFAVTLWLELVERDMFAVTLGVFPVQALRDMFAVTLCALVSRGFGFRCLAPVMCRSLVN